MPDPCGWCGEPAVTEVVVVHGRVKRKTAPVCETHALAFERAGQMTVRIEVSNMLAVNQEKVKWKRVWGMIGPTDWALRQVTDPVSKFALFLIADSQTNRNPERLAASLCVEVDVAVKVLHWLETEGWLAALSEVRRRIEYSVGPYGHIYERDGYRCQRCWSIERLSIDHIVPRIRGGGDEDSNLQVLCRSCNSEKGTT